MVCHRWWKAAINAARVVLFWSIEAEVHPAYGLPGLFALYIQPDEKNPSEFTACDISHMLRTYVLITR